MIETKWYISAFLYIDYDNIFDGRLHNIKEQKL